MKLLLDTHVLLWWLRDNPRLRPRARALISDPGVTVLVSIASMWELSIKYRLGKQAELGSAVLREAVDEGFELVGITVDHLAALEQLPHVKGHGDPFDHLLLAQAKVEGALLMTADRKMPSYGVRCLGIG